MDRANRYYITGTPSNYPQANAAYDFKEDWRTYANTPGHAMQFKKW